MKLKLSDIFGTYDPPLWIKALGKVLGSKRAKSIYKIGGIALGSILALLVLFFIGIRVYGFIQSKKPQDRVISLELYTPDLNYDLKAPFTISFYGSACPPDKVGTIIEDKIDISPKIKGSWKWDGVDYLKFTPSEAWSIGTTYSINLPKTIFAEHVKPERNTVGFFTNEFVLQMIESPDYVIDDENSKLKYITFALSGNFPIDIPSLQKAITIEPDILSNNGDIEKRKYNFTINYVEENKTAYIKSEPMGNPKKDLNFKIKISKGVHSTYSNSSVSGEITSSVFINGYSSFAKVRNSSIELLQDDKANYKQVLNIETSAKVSTEELSSRLHFYVLPKDRPEMPGHKLIRNCNWNYENTSIFTDELLKTCEALPVLPCITENQYEYLHSYEIDVPQYSYICVTLDKGVHFYGDYYLEESYAASVKAPSYPTKLSFMSEGTLISSNGSKSVPIMSSGHTRIRGSLYRLKSGQLNHIISQSNGNLKNFSFNSYKFDEDNLAEPYEVSLSVMNSKPGAMSYTSFDLRNYLNNEANNLKGGLFIFKISSDSDSDKRLLIVTDQAMMFKKSSNGDRDLFIQSISTGLPVAYSNVEVISLNGNVIFTGTTDLNGHVYIPSLNGNNSSHVPVAIVATKGIDTAFIPYNGSGNALDYSSFDVGGLYGYNDPKKISAYVFNDRGVYRPGDEIRFGAIVKSLSWSIDLEGTTMSYNITDPNGVVVSDKDFRLNKEGFEEFKFSTKDYSPTGSYTFTLYLRKKHTNDDIYERIVLSTSQCSVEEFQPDTLQISSCFNPLPSEGWIKPKELTGVVKLKNLFGTDAVGNDVKADITLTPGYIRTNKYPGYRFNDPCVGDNTYNVRLEDTRTDEEGYAYFPIDMENFSKASYKLTFSADGFEKESGRSVTSVSSVFVSPLDYLIGFKVDGALDYINKGDARLLKLLCIGQDLNPMKVDDVTLSIIENRYVSVLVKQPNGIYKYQSVKKEYPLISTNISIDKKGLDYVLPVDNGGEFTVRLTNKDGLEFNKFSYSVVDKTNVQRSLSRTAELEVRLEKNDYKNGEEATLFIKAPYEGSGLICIEKDKVYSYQWFKMDSTSGVQKIKIPDDIEGNGYITVMYSRAFDSKEIYMSPFCYAASPFTVSFHKLENNITLVTPDTAKPGEDFTIKYKASKKGKIVIMAIDEGILSYAHYQSPKPLPYFFKKRALEVSTYQLMDLVMPDLKVMKSLSRMGGGEYYMNDLSHNLNPFKRKKNIPVAFWSGVIDCDDTYRSVSYKIPDYFNGRIRVMAVAVNSSSLGVKEASTEVRADYIIMPNSPYFASPNDEFNVSVTVTNNDSSSDEQSPVVLSLETTEGLEIIGDSKVSLDIKKGRDKTHIYRLKAKDILGNQDLKFRAQGAKNFTTSTVSLSLRPSMPYQVWLTSGKVRKSENTKDKVDVNKDLYSEFSTHTVNMSYLPLALCKGLDFYLTNYPYGCSEQVTSKTYPYLFEDLLKAKNETHKEAQKAIDDLVEILQSRMKRDGSIGYWTNKSDSYASLNAYIALFLTDAKDKGYDVPQRLLNEILGYLRNCASSDASPYERAFCIYVLTRNEIITTEYLERLKKDMTNSDKFDLASMYLAASYKLLKLDTEGNKVMNRLVRGSFKKEVRDRFEDDLYYQSTYLYLISKYYPNKLSEISGDLLESIEKEIVGCKYSSLSSAFALKAIEAYLEAVPGSKDGLFTVTDDLGSSLAFSGENLFTSDYNSQAKSLFITNKEKNNLYYQVVEAGFEKVQTPCKSNLELYRSYSTRKGGSSEKSFNRGDDVYVTIRVRTLNNTTVNNVALIDMLPSGFEADIKSIRENDSKLNFDNIDVREDRVIFYGTITPNLREFTYKVSCITEGVFVTPPLYGEGMYDKNYKTVFTQEPITINSPKEKHEEDEK